MFQQNTYRFDQTKDVDFFGYWDSLGFFDNIKAVLPHNFFVLFEIARTIFSEETTNEAFCAIEELVTDEQVLEANRDENLQVNRLEKIAPVSDKMEIDTYKNINELKKALPRELANDDEVFNMKLFTKSLLVQKFYESESDSFKPISTSKNEKGKDANRFEQKFYLLFDRSKSMEIKMRDFYSKCIVAELLRRKMQSKAKIYYRPFDSKTGPLFRLEKRSDFPQLIENVLFTTTGGKSTNIEGAISQAISDIRYDKEMLKSEILVITDGISKINKLALKEKLGDIKLNILKIGDELAEPDFYDLEKSLKDESIDFNPTALNIKQIRNELKNVNNSSEKSTLNINERRVYQLVHDISDNMFKDLKELANRFIEIKDYDAHGIFDLSKDKLENISQEVEKFTSIEVRDKELNEKTKIYRHVHFLGQYIKMLFENGNSSNTVLIECYRKISEIKQQLLKDPELLFTLVKTGNLDDDKKLQKLAKKELKGIMKNLQLDERKLSFKDMQKAQLLFTMDAAGKGGSGQFFVLVIVLILKGLKKIVMLPAIPFRKKKMD